MSEGKKLAFLGLGVMGYPMAGHLARAGHEVTVFNRSPAKADAWRAEYGGKAARTPAEAAKGRRHRADVRRQRRRRARGRDRPRRRARGMAKGTVLVDHTTASADVAREVHGAAAAKGVGFLDAPVSGGQAGAQNGKLTIMVGGDEATFARAEACSRTTRAR
jgi:3-hydroxyisobutyrate dehydrogenase